MSTASQRRKARREHLQRPFAEKVREVALSLPRRKPAPADGMQYVDRIEEQSPIISADDYPNMPCRRRLWLRTVLGDERTILPRRFVIPFCEPSDRQRAYFDPSASFDEINRDQIRYVEFTWRSMGLNAGDTSIRWYVPEVTDPYVPGVDTKPFYAARKAASYAVRAIHLMNAWGGPEWVKRDLMETVGALQEFIGEIDPDETRAERETETNREIRQGRGR